MADRLYGNLTDAAADDILDGLLATCYVALYTDTPGDAGGDTAFAYSQNHTIVE